MGVQNSWLNNVPQQPVVIIDTDVGGDPDDIFAMVLAASLFKERVSLVTTIGYCPEEKSRISDLVFRKLGLKPQIAAGYGVYKNEDSSHWLERFPCWAKRFGIPGETDKVTLLQAKPYRNLFKKFDSVPVTPNSAADELVKLCRASSKDVVIIGQAPLSNLAQAKALDAESLSTVNRIVLMGGWFEDDERRIVRLGFNTNTDLHASKQVLQQKTTPVLIVNSEMVKKFNFTLRDKEREVFRMAPSKIKLGKALYEDMENYWLHKTPSGGELGLADALTVYLAKHPEAISHSRAVEIEFDDDLLHVDMFHPQSKKAMRVREVAESNIRVVDELHDPLEVRKALISSLVPLFYPGVSVENFWEALDSSDDLEIVVDALSIAS